MHRTTLVLSLAVLGVLAAARPGHAGDSCGLVPTVQPLRDEDKAKQEVTYAGEAQNRGSQTARFSSVRLQIVNRTSGDVLGEDSEALDPSPLAPGQTAKFKVTASNKGSNYLDVKVDEKLTFEATRCEAPDPAAGADGSSAGACDVVVSQPFEKSIDDQAHTITFTGTVENRGSGTAKDVQVTGWVISQDELLAKSVAASEPRNLGPGVRGTFRVTVPLAAGQRKSVNDRVTVAAERCD